MNTDMLSLKWDNYQSSFLESLAHLRLQESYADLTIACDGKCYDVHKLVLATCSGYFKEIFRRISNKSHVVIVLPDVKSADFEWLLDYMYVGSMNIQQDSLESVMKAGQLLKIKGLMLYDNEDIQNLMRGSESKKLKGDHTFPQIKKQRIHYDDIDENTDTSFKYPSTTQDDNCKQSLTVSHIYPKDDCTGFLPSSSQREIDTGTFVKEENFIDVKMFADPCETDDNMEILEEAIAESANPLLKTPCIRKTSYDNEQPATNNRSLKRVEYPYRMNPEALKVSKERLSRGSFEESLFSMGKRKRCFRCPSRKDRKTQTYCMECVKPVCREHSTSTILCEICIPKNMDIGS